MSDGWGGDESTRDGRRGGGPSGTVLGLFVGVALGFGAVLDGFVGFVLVAIFAAVGLIVGRVIDGQLDLSDYLGGRRRDR